MLKREDHITSLADFEIDQLLKLLRLEAQKHHDGHYTIFAFTTNFKVAFGTPSLGDDGRPEIQSTPGFATLKEAIIHALVETKSFQDYLERRPN